MELIAYNIPQCYKKANINYSFIDTHVLKKRDVLNIQIFIIVLLQFSLNPHFLDIKNIQCIQDKYVYHGDFENH